MSNRSASPDAITPTGPALDDSDRKATLMQQAIAAKVLTDLAKIADTNVRALLLEELLTEYQATGRKTFDAEAFGLKGIGTITLPEGKDRAVVADPEVFLEYVEDHHPAEVRTVSHPDPAWQRAFLASLALTPEGPVNPITGEVIPGLAVETAGAPSKFNVNLAKTSISQVTETVLSHAVAALTVSSQPGAIEGGDGR